ncbi:MAG: hypothetical protein EOM20_17480 [Spartobacteria bacterium]|nr:hypothetical protein [Spartobacteria bacterium]
MHVTLKTEVLVGIVVALVALVGSALGTWSAVINTEGPRERRYLILGYVSMWIVTLVLLPLIFIIPRPWNYIELGVLCMIIPVMTYRITLRSLLLRTVESRDRQVDGL